MKNRKTGQSMEPPGSGATGRPRTQPRHQIYPLISERELAAITHPGTRDKSRKPAVKAMETLAQMAEDGVIILQTGLKTSGGEPAVKSLPPPGWGPNWNPPAEFLKRKKA